MSRRTFSEVASRPLGPSQSAGGGGGAIAAADASRSSDAIMVVMVFIEFFLAGTVMC